jgi:hypothetical protein
MWTVSVTPAGVHPFTVQDLLQCGCGQKISGYADGPFLCDGCAFRHTVMKAAGREQEFWDARPTFVDPGWVSYNIKYTVSDLPDTTIRLRTIKAGEENEL